jgi:malonyl-CoA O-methyltransferase
MASTDDRSAITTAFSKHASSYDQFARVQSTAAHMLDQHIANFVEEDAANIHDVVDLGCGTGHLSEYLIQRFPSAHIQLCDISATMLDHARQRLANHPQPSSISTIEGDAETQVFLAEVDLIASNFCAQWFAEPQKALAHHFAQSRYIAWTTLVSGTFQSWINAHLSRGTAHGVRDFSSFSALQHAVEQLAPKRSRVIVHRETIRFANARAFLHELRAIGATTPRAGYDTKNLLSIIPSFENGFTAEYEIAIILMEKSCVTL